MTCALKPCCYKGSPDRTWFGVWLKSLAEGFGGRLWLKTLAENVAEKFEILTALQP